MVVAIVTFRGEYRIAAISKMVFLCNNSKQPYILKILKLLDGKAIPATKSNAEAYSEPWQISKMELSRKKLTAENRILNTLLNGIGL